MCSIRRRAGAAEKAVAAVEERFQTIDVHCTSFERQVRERLKRLREWVKAEVRAIAIKCFQFMGDWFKDLAKYLVQFLTKNDKRLNAILGKLRVLSSGSAEAAIAVTPCPLVDFGTHAAVSTNPVAILPARLPLVVDPVVESTPLFSTSAFASNTATPVETGVVGGSKILTFVH